MPVRLLCAVVVSLGGDGLAPSSGGAQVITTGRLPQNVEMTIDERPYSIGGETAADIQVQLRVFGPRFRWTDYSIQSRWSATREQVLRGGRETGRCRVADFSYSAFVRSVYPEWDPSPTVEPPLLEAWTAFQELIRSDWERVRDRWLNRASRVTSEVRRKELDCRSFFRQLSEFVTEVWTDQRRAESLAENSSPTPRLQWPPLGYVELLGSGQPATEADGAPMVSINVPTDFEKAVSNDVDLGTAGLAAGLVHDGELHYLDAFGAAGKNAEDSLTVDTPFPFPALTEVLAATIAASLDAAGALDLTGPISAYLPELEPSLGSVTLEQLLAHRSGLDDAAPEDSTSWSTIVDALDDRSLFAPPGAVFSSSRYNFPLAIRTIERVTGRAFTDFVHDALFVPLEMENTSFDQSLADSLALARAHLDPAELEAELTDTLSAYGIPVPVTTARDLMRFLLSWTDGAIRGATTTRQTRMEVGVPERRYDAGLWWDWVAGQPRLSLHCGPTMKGAAVGFQVFPETRSVFVLWSNGYTWPDNTGRFLLTNLGTELGAFGDMFTPHRIVGIGQSETIPRPCRERVWTPVEVVQTTLPAPVRDWAGRYTNGDRMVIVEDADGLLQLDLGQTLQVAQYSSDVFFANLNGQSLFPFQLEKYDAGRRYLRLGDRAYIHDDDRPNR